MILRPGLLILLVACLLSLQPPPLRAATAEGEIGVVVMHGKGGRPDRRVSALAEALAREGFQVANLEMPWSARRQYDVDLETAVGELDRALDDLRAKGARKLFVSGHSQGGVFALLFGARRKVDGLAVIVPGGTVDARVYRDSLGGHVARARQMVADGQGGETAEFADFEGSKGSFPVTTRAAAYLSWFDPNGAFSHRVYGAVPDGTPVLYVTATRDYPGLKRFREQNFAALPGHPLKRMPEVDADHLNAPTAAAPEVIRWIRDVVAR